MWHTRTHTHTHTHTYIDIYIYVCVCVWVYVRVCHTQPTHTHTYIYIYIYIYICVCVCVCVLHIKRHDNSKFSHTYEVHSIGFRTFFIRPFKIVVHSWKFCMLLLSILWDNRPIFMFSGSNEQRQQQLEYTLLKPDCHSWWISKMQSDNLEERYAIKFYFKLGKNAIETYGMRQTAFRSSCMNRESVFEWHKRFQEGRESLRDDERCGRSKEVNTPELIGQRFWVRVTILRF